jgi:hypothetical protein
MSKPLTNQRANIVRDVEQLGIGAGRVPALYDFWICDGVEMLSLWLSNRSPIGPAIVLSPLSGGRCTAAGSGS